MSSGNKPSGTWDQTIGSSKESLGNLLGHENLRKSGQEQNATGKAQEAENMVSDWGEGVASRVMGALGSVGAAVKGDTEHQKRYSEMRDQGRDKQHATES
ncbi:hypothetical protein MPDQ_003487 [Monascus purpureus]|uniref:CsbD-like domain-containing protein n=1 Tax=Monascus purpureus TaxID=5098 RepID=A0A507R3T8_MONPU|nr:hypothetical protein MPDQ_003487 [Monascus purpureus]BDD57141.1 hypothetical protein MAP00_002533 [Monascus purpureus]